MDLRIKVLKWSHIVATYAIWLMVTYLTDVWELGITNAAGIVNVLTGAGNMLQIVFAFIADELTGKYLMLLLSSIAYTIGLGFLCMSTPPVLSKATSNCAEYKSECIGQTQRVLFYTSLALIAVGISGLAVSLDSFSEKQKILESISEKLEKGKKKDGEDDELEKSCIHYLVSGIGAVVAVVLGIVLPYTKSWKVQFGIPAICTLTATLLFISGSRSYKTYCPRPKEGSPLKAVFRVFVASAYKIFRQLPHDKNKLYGKDEDSSQNLPYPGLSFLDKAAIISTTKSEEEQKKNKWTLCSVADVEKAKKLIRIAPICLTFVISGIAIAVGNTYFVEQANHLNRKVGRITVPLSIFLAWMEFEKLILSKNVFVIKFISSLFFEDESKDPEVRKMRRLLGTYVPIVIAFFIHVIINLTCITAAKVEMRRLHAVRKYGLFDKPDERIPMSVFWLVPQFALLSMADVLYKSSLSHFFSYHAPSCMKEYSGFFHKGVMGLGAIGSVLLVFILGKVSESGGKRNWFQFTLNESRLDHYYWTLSGLCAVNLVLYVLALCFYDWKVFQLEDPKDEPAKEVSEEIGE